MVVSVAANSLIYDIRCSGSRKTRIDFQYFNLRQIRLLLYQSTTLRHFYCYLFTNQFFPFSISRQVDLLRLPNFFASNAMVREEDTNHGGEGIIILPPLYFVSAQTIKELIFQIPEQKKATLKLPS